MTLCPVSTPPFEHFSRHPETEVALGSGHYHAGKAREPASARSTVATRTSGGRMRGRHRSSRFAAAREGQRQEADGKMDGVELQSMGHLNEKDRMVTAFSD